ncbi:OsmC family protein [Paenibacillus aestuarii]|uniref:OsmC family protein n=1 Tax=Paenibacillus aestuarii TaxID=516965 RepID=A0ABW0K196_9BACL|nr:OsmC family protein [Paenibacillus aestuarii]
MSEHRFILTAEWSGGLHGTGEIRTNSLMSPISVPAGLGGPGLGTNPEDLLLGAAATCYLITLGAILHKQGIEQLELTSEITVDTAPAMKVKRLIHRPRIRAAAGTSEAQLEKIKNSAIRAELVCMISKALRGNVEISVEPEIWTGGIQL